MKKFSTCDIYDKYENSVQVLSPALRSFGAKSRLSGIIKTVKCFDDNTKVKEVLATNGENQILVVDGAGSLNCALLGDLIAQSAIDNNWQGVVVYGCVRDIDVLKSMQLGVYALHSIPKKSTRRGAGETDIKINFLNAQFESGMYMYADLNGILVASQELQID